MLIDKLLRTGVRTKDPNRMSVNKDIDHEPLTEIVGVHDESRKSLFAGAVKRSPQLGS